MRPWGYQNLVLDPKAAFRTAWNQAWTRHWCWTVTCHVAVPQSWFLWCQDMLFFQPRWDDDSMTFYDFHIFGLKVDTTRKIGHSWTVDLPTWSEILKCEPDLGWPSPFFFLSIPFTSFLVPYHVIQNMHQIHIVTDHHFPWDLSWGQLIHFAPAFSESHGTEDFFPGLGWMMAGHPKMELYCTYL